MKRIKLSDGTCSDCGDTDMSLADGLCSYCWESINNTEELDNLRRKSEIDDIDYDDINYDDTQPSSQYPQKNIAKPLYPN